MNQQRWFELEERTRPRHEYALDEALRDLLQQIRFPYVRRLSDRLVVVGAIKLASAGITHRLSWTLHPYPRQRAIPPNVLLDYATAWTRSRIVTVNLVRATRGDVLRMWINRSNGTEAEDLPGSRLRIILDESERGWHVDAPVQTAELPPVRVTTPGAAPSANGTRPPTMTERILAYIAENEARYRQYRHRATGSIVTAHQTAGYATCEGEPVAEPGEWWVRLANADLQGEVARIGRAHPKKRAREFRIVALSDFVDAFSYDDDRPAPIVVIEDAAVSGR